MLNTHDLLRQEIDSYKDTVWLILAFINEMLWDERSRRLRSDVIHEHGSPQELEQGLSITPDVALLVAETNAYLGEAKIGFAKNPASRDAIRDQLLKYDALLSSWTTPAPGVAARAKAGCIVMLTHHTRKTDAGDYLEAEQKAGRFRPKCEFSIVSGVRTSQKAETISLERHFGRLLPEQKDRKLRAVVAIKVDDILVNYGSIKFYDANPPMAYLLEIIWDSVLPIMVPEEEFERIRSKRGGGFDVHVDVAALAQRLRDSFSMRLLNPNLPESPRTDLVKKALDHLVEFKLAHDVGAGAYRVTYRRLRQGTLEAFLRKLAPVPGPQRGKREDERQLSLLGDLQRKQIEKPREADS